MMTADNLNVNESLNEAVRILLNLQHTDLEKRNEAIKQAGNFVEERTYFPEAVPLLIKLLEQEKHPKLAEEAAWALWKFKDSRAVPVLFKKAKTSAHLSLRKKSIRALGLLEAPEALPLLCHLVYDKSYILRGTAIAALGHFKEPKLLSILEGAMEDESSYVRREAIAAFGRFLRRNPKPLTVSLSKKITRFLAQKNEKDPSVRLEALKTLSYLEEKSVRKRLRKSSEQDPSAFVREGALALLQHWEDAQSETALIEGLQDRDWSVRFASADLLIQRISRKIIFNRIPVLLALHKIANIFPKTNPTKQTAADLLKRFNAL
ncbi:MAG: HEAT repeat domain-containing protein [Deltaproteobacteria bacterium]|nr:HEAT repeat domain-containing protein [Deltaproteobacteria bacterium]